MMKLLILIVATCVVGGLCAEEKCVPGTTFMEDCNKCRCGADGQKACTRKMCPPNELSDDSQVRTDVQNGDSLSSVDEKEEMHVQSNGQVCSPNEIKMKDCNRCRCANNGIGWFCTRRACPPREKRAALSAKENCTPGKTFPSDDGCNTCFCDSPGKVACTIMACNSDYYRRKLPESRTEKRVKRSETEQECIPGTKFPSDDGCNTCFCSYDGTASCTLVSCISDSSRKKIQKQCIPGTRFPSDDGCNTCFCSDNGIAACTAVGCISDYSRRKSLESLTERRVKRSETEKKCTPGTTFPSDDGCNICFCSGGEYMACTRKDCSSDYSRRKLPETRTEKRVKRSETEKKCTPGTTFPSEDGCNTCFCSGNGIAACTLRACKTDFPPLLPLASLTEKRVKRSEAEKKCTPGTTFRSDDGCNTCFCTNDGQAACTLKACLPAKPQQKQKRETLPQSDIAPGAPGFSCEPKSSFKYQCNTCLCSDDGKMAGCTFKYCIPGEW